MKIFKIEYLIGLATLFALNACQSTGENQTGSEFVPDMAHSIAIEANVYHDYSLNNFDETSVKQKTKRVHAGLPVSGTVPRGYAGDRTGAVSSNVSTKGSGSVPYYYGDTEEERARAMAEITLNPYPISGKALEQGKELFDIYCAICHGPKGDGLGYLVADENKNQKYPAAPANLIKPEFIEASEGRFYHAIMFGKNVMGSHADKLDYEERWNVIHYIRSLQAKEMKAVYSEEENTLNNSATPYNVYSASVETNHGSDLILLEEEADGHDDGHGHDDHGDDHSH